METIHRCQPNAVGSQAFQSASAFDANIGAWNVLRVANCDFAFHSVGLADCIKRGVYDNWGSTLQKVYPAWNSLSVCITDSNIRAAVTAWVANPTAATTTYGDIADWNTASVTSMGGLFQNNPTFNADISKWNVASVVNMYQVCTLQLSLCGMSVYVYMYLCLYLHIHIHTYIDTHTHTHTHTLYTCCVCRHA